MPQLTYGYPDGIVRVAGLLVLTWVHGTSLLNLGLLITLSRLIVSRNTSPLWRNKNIGATNMCLHICPLYSPFKVHCLSYVPTLLDGK